MFKLVLSSGSPFEVQGKVHRYRYATDGSLPNPLESTYAALAGCAGVYARKACKQLGIDESGIDIDLRIVASPAKPLMPARIVTSVRFPDRFDGAQRAAIVQSIQECAVKALIENGANIEFTVEETSPAAA